MSAAIVDRPAAQRSLNARCAFAAAILLLAACAPSGEQLLARAEQQLANGEFRGAMIDLRNYLSRNPDDARARARLGLVMLEIGDVTAAEAEIAKAKSLGAARELTLAADCRLMVARDAYDTVLQECTAPAGAAELATDLAVTRGDALIGLKRYDEARASFESALAARPNSLNALQGLAAAAFGSGGIEAARSVFAAAPDSVRQQPRYWLALGSLELQSGAYEQAEAAFATAVKRTADDAESPHGLAALAGLTESQLRLNKLEAAKATGERLLEAAPKSPLAKLLGAQAAASAGDLVRARELLEEVVSVDPENTQARALLGLVNLRQGNLGQAEMHLATVVARQPDNVRAQKLLAEVRSRLQSPELTLESLKPTLARPQADPSLLTLASRLSMQSGNRDEALAYLAQAADSAVEKSPEAQLEIAGGYLAAGDFDRAIELLEAMPGDGAGSLQRDSLLVAALLRQGKTAEVIAKADAIAAAAGKNTAARNVAAAAYAAAGQRDRARAEYAEVLKARPDDIATRLNLARLELHDGKADAASKQLQAVLKQDPKNLAAALGMSVAARLRGDAKDAERWIRKVSADHPESPQAKLAVAQFYLGNRDFGQARQAADEALKLSPGNAAVLNVRGLAQLGAGDGPEAITSLLEAVKQAPQAVGYRLNLGRAYVMQRDAKSALGAFDAALQLDGNSLPAMFLAATTALQAGQVERAAGYVERLRRLAPDAPSAMRLEGDLAMAQKRYRDAVGYYDKALAAGGDTLLVGARYRAARLSGMRDPEKSLQDWLAKRPEDTTARILLAEHFEQGGDDASARREYEKILERSPNNAVALNNLSVIYQRQGDERAAALAKRAYDAAPNSAAIQDTYGWLLVEQGEVERGLELLRSAAKGMPEVPDVQFHLGVALARKGLASEAAPLLEQVVRSDAPAGLKADARRELNRLPD